MFGFSSHSCYDCLYLDKYSIKGDRGWCEESKKWVTLSGSACRNWEESFYIICAYAENMNIPKHSENISLIINFRNEYMKSNEEGQMFLNEYNLVGPMLARKLVNDSEKNIIFTYLHEIYILPIINFIKENRLDDAQKSYIEMVNELKVRYQLNVTKEKTLAKF